MNVEDFYASPTPRIGTPALVPASTTPRPAPHAAGKDRSLLWPVSIAVVALVGLVVAAVVLLWPHSSGSSGPDPATARIFGQQTRPELPQPVESADCAAAVRAFPAIARDAAARAAFVDGCVHG